MAIKPSDIKLELALRDNCLQLDGVDDYVDCQDPGISENAAYTIEFWARVPKGRGLNTTPVAYSEITPANFGTQDDLQILFGDTGDDDHVVVAILDGGAAAATLESTTDVTNGNWFHVAFIQAGLSSRKLLINGVEEDTDTTTLVVLAVTDAYIGATDNNGTRQNWCHEKMEIREVRLWDDERSAAEIVANMWTELAGTEAGLIAYWKAEDGSGATLTDSDSGGNFDGTITGGTWNTRSGPIWTDVWADVLGTDPIKLSYGIPGIRPTDRVAHPGHMTFHLNNSASNSGTTIGYYSPGHGSVRSGFAADIGVRIRFEYSSTWYYKFVGRLKKIVPITGLKGPRKTKCIAKDFLEEMRVHKVNLLDVQTDYRSDQLFKDLIDNMGISPPDLTINTGQEIFAYTGDDLKDEKITTLAATGKVAMSEFGYVFQRGNTIFGGEVVFEDRHTRVKNTTVVADIDDTMSSLVVESDVKHILNKIRAVTYPREVGSSAETLFTLQQTIEIAAGGTKTLVARYTDPSARASRISGKDMQDPEGANEITEAGDERGFESGTTGWTVSGTDTDAIAQSTAQAKHGDYSLKLISGTGAAHTNFIESDKYSGFVQNDIVYVQAWIQLEEAWPAGVRVAVREYDAGDVVGTTTVLETQTTTGSWIRVSGTHTCVDADCAKLALVIGEHTAQDFSGGTVDVYIDEVYLIDDAALNFEFSSSSSGGGDLNGNLLLHASTVGANSTEYHLENEGSTAGHVTSLKAKGLAVRRYEPATAYAEDPDSQEEHGVRELVLILPYQDSVLRGQDWVDITLDAWKDPQALVTQGMVVWSTRDATTIVDILETEPGSRIELTETVSGFTDAEFFVNKVELTVFPYSDAIQATWIIVPAGTYNYWVLGISTLGENNYLGF